jgi:alanine racemase
MSRVLQALIDPVAIQHNLRRVKTIAPASKIIAMVKANGYGHGLLEVAQMLNKADAFGVACLEEALQLRQNDIIHKIVLMQGFVSKQELVEISRLSLEAVIHNDFQLQLLASYSRPINVWLKLDTGMHRLGFSIEEFSRVYNYVQELPHVNLIGIMSHFSHADEVHNIKTVQQIEQFVQTIKTVPETFFTSLANSSGILQWPAAHLDWVRPGLMLYGVSPIGSKRALDYDLLPAMTLQTEIISINNIKQGETIGYSGSFTCPEDMPVAVIAIGYGDGYPRNAPNGTPVLVNGKRASLIGKVSMDMANIDLREVPGAKIGDKVVMWGRGLPVEEIAEYVGTISYELLANLGNRVQRVVKSIARNTFIS